MQCFVNDASHQKKDCYAQAWVRTHFFTERHACLHTHTTVQHTSNCLCVLNVCSVIWMRKCIKNFSTHKLEWKQTYTQRDMRANRHTLISTFVRTHTHLGPAPCPAQVMLLHLVQLQWSNADRHNCPAAHIHTDSKQALQCASQDECGQPHPLGSHTAATHAYTCTHIFPRTPCSASHVVDVRSHVLWAAALQPLAQTYAHTHTHTHFYAYLAVRPTRWM